jgi:putative redox protein
MAPKQTVPFVIHASGTGVAQRLEIPGSHVFESDTYPAFGGADAHPSPLSYALGALTSCNQVTANVVAKELGLTLGEFSFEIQGDLDPSVMVGGAEGNANFDSVQVRATIQSDATPEQFETLRAETERRCPVSQLFIRSGLDFDAQWTQAPLAERAAA